MTQTATPTSAAYGAPLRRGVRHCGDRTSAAGIPIGSGLAAGPVYGAAERSSGAADAMPERCAPADSAPASIRVESATGMLSPAAVVRAARTTSRAADASPTAGEASSIADASAMGNAVPHW